MAGLKVSASGPIREPDREVKDCNYVFAITGVRLDIEKGMQSVARGLKLKFVKRFETVERMSPFRISTAGFRKDDGVYCRLVCSRMCVPKQRQGHETALRKK
ncbi:MAG: hypothetical protein LBP50_08150 [Tannerella sp.]|jgi:hypothetical protein|nr:hypothetical protein [Tannerella sp.]